MGMQIEKGTRYETKDGDYVRVTDIRDSEYLITEDDEVLTTPLVEYHYESDEVFGGVLDKDVNTKSAAEFRSLLRNKSEAGK